MDHLTLDEYWEALRGKVPFRHLAQQAHEHLVDTCPTCRDEWRLNPSDAEQGVRTGNWGISTVEAVPPDLPDDDRAASLADLERTDVQLTQSREAARLAREDLKLLLALPPDQWRQRVERARTRMRSRAFAELLVEEAGRRIERSPEEAELLASLVRPALDRRQGRLEQEWARALVAQAGHCAREATVRRGGPSAASS